MEFTGERYIPSVEGQIKYEHLHRYALSLSFVAGKSVMDIASGEGYGAALLASKAQSVTGVDIDPESIKHAKHTYYANNLSFVVGSCDSVPLPGASFDVVTSFETIEHHDKHDEMLREIKRVLKPEGILIISSPNRLTYSDKPGYTNPFHVKELYHDEFYELLRKQFKYVRVYGQRLATASFVGPLQDSTQPALEALTGDVHQILHKICSLPSPIYFVAVCSDNPAIEERAVSSVYLDPANDLLKAFQDEKVDEIHRMQERMQEYVRKTEEAMRNVRFGYETQIRRQRDELKETRAKYRVTLRERDKSITDLRVQLETAKTQIERYQAWLSEARSQVSLHAELLDWMYTNSQMVQRSDQWNERWNQFQKRIRRLPAKEAIRGVLDYPKSEDPAKARIEVYGWAYSNVAPLRLVQAFLDNTYLGIVRYGIERSDVVAAFPDAPVKCGYQELFWLDGLGRAGERSLRILVSDQKGNKQVYTRPITLEAPTPLVSSEVSPTPVTEHLLSRNVGPEEPTFAGQLRQVEAAIADFQNCMARDPSILDWDSGLNIESSFRDLAVCSFAGADTTLPYFDRSIDMVVVPASRPEWLAEAKRVAAAAVIRVQREAVNRPEAILEVEWLDDQMEAQTLPMTSIIIPVHNQANYTQNCLEQLIRTLPHNFSGEIIVVDDASSDETKDLLDHWTETDNRIKVLRNSENAGFIKSCNRGAEAARGEILVFLNNDTLPSAGWLPPLLRIFRDKPDAGAAGGKLVYPDGTLQEAGAVVFSDGSACNFGKHDEAADAPLYNFVHEVDYCSGALLATRRDLFTQLGGFDVRFAPAYYEDADYCFSLRSKGYRVYYQPESVIVHFEGVSCGVDTSTGVKSYQDVNRIKFVEKWIEALRDQPPAPERYDLATLHSLSIRNAAK